MLQKFINRDKYIINSFELTYFKDDIVLKKISNLTQMKAGAFLSYAQIALSAIMGLVYTPIMLRLMGQNEYGLYGTVNSTVELLSLLDLGFTSSYIRFYSKYKIENRQDKINSFNALFFIVFFVIAVIAAVLGFSLSANPAVIFDNGLTESELVKSKIMIVLLTTSMIVGFLNTVINCYIFANQKFIFSKGVGMAISLSTVAFNLIVLFAGYGAVGLVVVSLLLNILSRTISAIYAFKSLHLKFDFKHIEKPLFKSVLAFSGLIAINMFVDKVNSGIDSILLGRFCGTAAVAIYSVGASLKSHFQTFSTAISGVFTPHIHNLVNSYEMDSLEQRNALTKFFVKVGRLQYLLLALIASGVVFFGKQFIYFWAGEGYEDSYIIALILIIPSIVPLIQNVGIEIQRAENRHNYRAYIYGSMALLNLIVSIFLCQILEGVGAALGTGIATLFANGLVMNIIYHKKINIDMKIFWKNILRQTAGMILPFISGILIMIFADTSSIFKLIAWIIVYVLIYCVCVWFFSMDNYEKNLFLNVVRKMAKTKNK